MVISSWKMTENKDGVTFLVKVQPRSSKNQIVGLQGGALKIKLTAPPVEGEANEACLRFISEWLSIHRSQVQLLSGQAHVQKVIRVFGMSGVELLERLSITE